jgi:hypothetical protein
MAIDNVPDLSDPSHNAMRAELARLFIANKERLGIGRFADADIATNIDDVARVVLAYALTVGPRFAECFPWLADAVARLQRGESWSRCLSR